MKGKTRLFFITVFLLFTAIGINATVSTAMADSIGHALNGAVCDQSCSYYAGEHNAIGIWNTLITFVLIALGTVWLYLNYKRKDLIVIGTLLGLAVMGTYFYPQIQNKQTVPANCPVVQSKAENKTVPATKDEFQAPASDEFESSGTTETENKNQESSSVQSADSKDEFAPAGDEFESTEAEAATAGDEFKSTEAEAAPADDEFSATGDDFSAETAPTPAEPKSIFNNKQILEPIIIFLIIGFISLMIKYPWFRKTRALFLLAGLVYLGFYRGACPCMISSFQNTVLAILGVSIKLESLLWFLLLVVGAYLFGKIWCGWLCHLGALQEFIFKSSKIKILATNKAQKILKGIQISVFIIWILQLIITKTNIFCEYDPFKVAFNLISASTTGYVLLAVLLISSVLIYRPFCRSICPVGFILGLTTYLPGSRKLDKDSSCIHCKSCDKECKQRALIHENKVTTLRNEDCIMCGECISECKIKALNVKWTKKGTKS